jgi:hypothetical protein
VQCPFIAINFLGESDRSELSCPAAPRNQVDDENNQRNYKQQVDQGACNVKRET